MKRDSSSIVRVEEKGGDGKEGFSEEGGVEGRTSNVCASTSKVVLLGKVKSGEKEKKKKKKKKKRGGGK